MSEMIEVDVAELEGPALDWAVAQIDAFCEGLRWEWSADHKTMVAMGDGSIDVCAFLNAKLSAFGMGARLRLRREGAQGYSPSSDWSHAGPLIEKRVTALNRSDYGAWWAHSGDHVGEAISPLVAAMRAIVAAELGDRVKVPAELMEANR